MVNKETFERKIKTVTFSQHFKVAECNLLVHRAYDECYVFYHGERESNPLSMDSFALKNYALMFNPKKSDLYYGNGPDKVHCVLHDSNWGNLVKALTDITNYEWVMQNEKAKNVLEKDSNHFYELEYFANDLLSKMLEKQDLALHLMQ